VERHDRIIDKLIRLPQHRLPHMQDVGGCRIVARSPQISLDAVADAVAARWEILADDDYVAHPRLTGYRARHLVVRYHGVAIEIQLRNVLQDHWAEIYETVHRDSDIDSRDAATQESVAAFFAALSGVFARRETSTIEGEEAMQELVDLLARYAPVLNALAWNAPRPDPT
jgi:putative GTP pyrophosphokinase